MPSRFLNNININDEYSLPNTDGSADQIITTDGAGQLSFVDQSTINAGNAEHVVIYAKNTSGASISKGTPVYITGTVGATDTVEIAPANASDSAKMPAVGLLDDTLANNAFGYVITGGFMDNITTDPIDSVTPSSNDTVYVKAGGGLTLTKPTGSNLIQNVAKVGKVSGGNSGSLIVSSILRTNDVPNLTTGKIWVGSAANTIESATVHLDEANTRMGIGTTSPPVKLVVSNGGASGLEFNPTGGVGNDAFIQSYNRSTSSYENLTYYANDHYFNSGSTTRMIIEANGNVGIGTTSPQSKLQANGGDGLTVTANDTAYSQGYFGRIQSDYGTNSLRIVSRAGDVFRATNFGQDVSILTGSSGSGTSERMRITSAGNVGIGTTSPNSKLQVDGEIDANGGDGYRINGKPWAAESSNVLRLGDWDGEGFSTSIYDENTIEIFKVKDQGVIINCDRTSTTTYGSDAGLVVGGSKFSAFGPGVVTLLNNDTTSQAGDSTGLIQFAIRDDNGTAAGYTSASIKGSIDFAAGTGSSGGGVLDFLTSTGALGASPTTRMRIDRLGNVGIGTTSPGAKLDVASGDIRLATNATYLRVKDSAGAQPRVLGINGSNTTYVGPIDSYAGGGMIYGASANVSYQSFRTAGSERVRIDSSGNVGIGTTSPSTKLHVIGTSSSMPSLGSAPTAAHFGGSSYGTLFSTLTSGRGVIQQGRVDGAQLSFDLLLQPVGGNVAIGKTSAGAKLDVVGDVRVDGLDNFLYTTNTNDIYTFGSSTQTMANAPNGYLWHDLLAFNYVYTTTQEVTSDGTNWSSTTLQKDLFAQKEGQAITVIGSTQTGVRWTFNNTAWGSAVLLNVAFTYVASDINKNILVESSSNGTSWTTRFTNTATAGTGTKTCKLTSYSGDAYVRVTITKAVSSSNSVRMSQLRLMTLRAGDQGYGREYQLPITWDGDRNIGIKLASPTTSISEALEVNGSVKATASTDAYKGYIKQNVISFGGEKVESSNYYFTAYNTTTTVTSAQSYNRIVAAYSGRVKKVYIRHGGGSTPTATAVNFKKHTNGTTSSTVYSATVASGATANMSAYYEFSDSDFTFSAGDLIGLLYQTTDSFGTASKTMGQAAVTITLEYNIT